MGPRHLESPVEFHLRFRRKSAVAEHERLLQAALSRPGNLERGRAVFLNVEKSLCLKCHRLGDQGERTGPELTGLGSRFSRIYIAESILQPSRAIAPSFGTVVVVLENGKVLSGVKVADSETTLTLVDNQGQKQLIAKAEIEEQAGFALEHHAGGIGKTHHGGGVCRPDCVPGQPEGRSHAMTISQPRESRDRKSGQHAEKGGSGASD